MLNVQVINIYYFKFLFEGFYFYNDGINVVRFIKLDNFS